MPPSNNAGNITLERKSSDFLVLKISGNWRAQDPDAVGKERIFNELEEPAQFFNKLAFDASRLEEWDSSLPVYNSDNQIVYSEFDRWAEPLDMNFSRVFRENLTCALGTLNLHVYPWRNPKVITHELSLEIVNFEVASDSSLNLKVFWQFSDFRQTEILKKGVFNENYKISKIDFDEIIRVKSNSLSDLCEALSTEILTVIRE